MCTADERGINERLLEGIKAKKMDSIREIVDMNSRAIINFDVQDVLGWTALMVAAQYNDVEMIQTLLMKGVNTTIKNNMGQTAAKVALQFQSRAAFNVLKIQTKHMTSVDHPFINYFSHVPLDRTAHKRKHPAWLTKMRTHPTTTYVIFSNLKPLAAKLEGEQRYRLSVLKYEQIEGILGKDTSKELSNIVFLGTQGNNIVSEDISDNYSQVNVPEESPTTTTDANTTSEENSVTIQSNNSCAWFAVDVGEIKGASEKFLTHCPEAVYLSPRPGFLQVHIEDATLLAQARPILEWHRNNKFCSRCGSTVKMDDGGYKQTCTNTECAANKGVFNVSYPRLDPVSIMLVISKDGKQCLLGRKPVFPKGMYSCLAGYMEPGETIEDSVRREVLEESGVDIDLVEYHSSQFWPYPTQLMIGCLAHARTDRITVDTEELEDAQWFSLDHVRQACRVHHPTNPPSLWFPPKQAIARQLIEHWVQKSSAHL